MRLWPFHRGKHQRRPAAVVARPRRLRARYDAAQTTADNRRHWANADGCSADAAASPAVRRTLRNRARYEVANNCYARGIVLTLANDVIGTGPRLQLLSDNARANQLLEGAWTTWAQQVDLPGKLRTMRMARAQDGEAFAVLFTNPGLPGPVQLDLRLVEADQVATPGIATGDGVDGIVYDAAGNPQTYHVLKAHPGAGTAGAASGDHDDVEARHMIHWYRQDRPGQRRGLPDILPALPLFAQLRRYTLAVIAAAETAAEVSLFLKTSLPPDGEAADVEALAEMDWERNTATFVPEGWEPSQVKAEQPATTYDMGKREILNEIARCLNMPYNIAACNSSQYNYASGRLDHQTYFKSIRVDQAQCETVVLDRIFAAWLEEAVLALGVRGDAAVPHAWFWDGHEHVDPLKEANAQKTRLASNTTTLAAEYARQGKDWEQELRQRAKEIALMRELGLPIADSKDDGGADADAADEYDREDEVRHALSR